MSGGLARHGLDAGLALVALVSLILLQTSFGIRRNRGRVEGPSITVKSRTMQTLVKVDSPYIGLLKMRFNEYWITCLSTNAGKGQTTLGPTHIAGDNANSRFKWPYMRRWILEVSHNDANNTKACVV